MSLRQIAKELGISPAYLSYMLNGKRPWRKDLYQRYMGVVNTFVNSEGRGVNKEEDDLVAAGVKLERKTRFELATSSLARRCSTTEPLPLYAVPVYRPGPRFLMVPRDRLELSTPAFSVPCSTT